MMARASPLRARTSPVLMVVASAGGKPANEVQCTVALVKNIVGSGVLSLPAGISRLSDGGANSGEALGLAALVLVLFGALNALGFLLIGEACAHTKQGSYVGAWRESIGMRSSFLPALCSLLLTFLATLACATVIRDVATDILQAGLSSAPLDGLSSEVILSSVSATVLLPLCLLPSLAPLGTASVLGVFGILATAGAMMVRWLDHSYSEIGTFASSALAAPAFHEAASGASGHLTDVPPSAGALCFFVSLVSNAFLAHYNAPSVFNECRAREQLKKVRESSPEAATAEDRSRRPAVLNPQGPSSGPTKQEVSPDAIDDEGVFLRLTSALAAEETNQLFQTYIESVPFGQDTQERAFEEGYRAGLIEGYRRAYETRIDETVLAAEMEAAPAELAADKDAELDLSAVSPSTGLASYRRVVAAAFGSSALLFLLIAFAGFATFGDAAEALILNNYAPNDPLAQLARIGILLAVVFEYPLLERPFRLTALELLLPVKQYALTSSRPHPSGILPHPV